MATVGNRTILATFSFETEVRAERPLIGTRRRRGRVPPSTRYEMTLKDAPPPEGDEGPATVH